MWICTVGSASAAPYSLENIERYFFCCSYDAEYDLLFRTDRGRLPESRDLQETWLGDYHSIGNGVIVRVPALDVVQQYVAVEGPRIAAERLTRP